MGCLAAAWLLPASLALAAPPAITSAGAVDVYHDADAGQTGMYFSFQVTATGEPTSFDAVGLPAWCTFNQSTGVLFGRTDTPGIADVTVSATNADGTGTATLQIRCHPAAQGAFAREGTFYPGETLWFDVHFNADVYVTGSPRLVFRIGADELRAATLDSGGGTSALRFAHLVGDDERSGEVAIVGLDLEGASVVDANGLEIGPALPLRHEMPTARVEARTLAPLGGPAIAAHPASATGAAGEVVTLAAATSGTAGMQWQRDGVNLDGANAATLTVAATPGNAGVYVLHVSENGASVLTEPAIVGVTTAAKVLGAATEVGANIRHPNGNLYDQVLLQGAAASVTADPGEVTRVSFIDLSDDIVQVEFAGAGTLSIALENFGGLAAPRNYQQPGVNYAKGHARLVVAGANETTYLSVFSVGRANAVNQALFRDDVDYDGVADVASVAILSANGKFGGLFAGNAAFVSTTGLAGIFAPDIEFTELVTIGNVSAAGEATPVLRFGLAHEVRITGGDLAQANGRGVQVSGLSELQLTAGATSHGDALPAQAIAGRLVEDDGEDVTSRLAMSGP